MKAALSKTAGAIVARRALLVLLENSDHEGETHAKAQFEKLLETAFEDGCVSDAGVAENLTQANQLWHIRESIPLAQAEAGQA